MLAAVSVSSIQFVFEVDLGAEQVLFVGGTPDRSAMMLLSGFD